MFTCIPIAFTALLDSDVRIEVSRLWTEEVFMKHREQSRIRPAPSDVGSLREQVAKGS